MSKYSAFYQLLFALDVLISARGVLSSPVLCPTETSKRGSALLNYRAVKLGVIFFCPAQRSLFSFIHSAASSVSGVNFQIYLIEIPLHGAA